MFKWAESVINDTYPGAMVKYIFKIMIDSNDEARIYELIAEAKQEIKEGTGVNIARHV